MSGHVSEALTVWRGAGRDALSEKPLVGAFGGHDRDNETVTSWPVAVDLTIRDRLVKRVAAQRARVQLITGSSGIGKSTLAAAISTRLQSMGFEALPVVGMPELQEIPLGAMAPLLGSADAPAFESSADRLQRLFALLSRAGSQHVLVVDDGPMLDPVSASSIYQLVRIYGMRCVMTARTEHLLSGPLLRLREEGFLEETELGGLSWPVASDIVQRWFGAPLNPDSLRALLALADGNPLFLRGLVLAAQQADAVHPGNAGLVIDTTRLPARLWDTIALRFDGLSQADRSLADLIAIAEPWPEELLAAPAELEGLSQASLIARSRAGDVYLAHPLFAETLTELMSAATRDRLRIDAARRLLAAGQDTLRFKALCLLAESSEPPSPDDLSWAATSAQTVDDHPLAIRLSTLAIDIAHREGQTPPFQAHLVRANALSMAGRLEEADAAFAVAAETATDDSERASIATRQGFHLAVRHQRPGDAVKFGRDRLALIADIQSQSFLASNVAKWQLMTGKAPSPAGILSADGAASADAATELNAALYRLSAAVFAGDLATIRSLIAVARPLTEAAHSVIRHGMEILDFAEFFLTVLDGRADDAATFGELKRGGVIDESAGMWSYGLAFTALIAGDAPAAMERATASVDLLAWRDFLGLIGTATALRATAAAQLGQFQLAMELLEGIDHSARTYITTHLQAAEAEAWLAWARGDKSGAVLTLAAAVETAVAARYFAFAALTAHLAVRMGQAESVLGALRECAAQSPGDVVAAIVRHAEAVAASNAAELLRAATRLAEVGLLAGAADAARQSAVLAHSSGDDRGARRANKLAAELGVDQRGRTLHSGPKSRSVLSAREWDIASAAAMRERNREIAGRLGLSPRTVENHLRNIFRKLGVTSRDELAQELDALERP